MRDTRAARKCSYDLNFNSPSVIKCTTRCLNVLTFDLNLSIFTRPFTCSHIVHFYFFNFIPFDLFYANGEKRSTYFLWVICLPCLFSEVVSRLSSSGVPSHDFYRKLCSACGSDSYFRTFKSFILISTYLLRN